MKPELLNEAAVQQALIALPGWQVEGRELTKEFQFASYLAGIEFVRQVARLAEEMNHHPDLLVRWRKVSVRLTTHSAGGLTKLDVELAGKIAAL
ncbi:4a-hydroxytetrahydrobiopterin dehydratase [Prosthecobacter sp.]|uniref:4a-hydroxytetrahydrobiopterin dehydratase n=1 Tax=Prosthecobacter sp. TaxID=1965333 RepID=UPI002ABB3312|nr:4a-hydroxytetrahydrobiopterin dehydratase [Prosthecobacter sp.]MDZ4403707.1 4a-hydroxytetrahydrobiopterin dehydratase [Prosthecobacter sp.]